MIHEPDDSWVEQITIDSGVIKQGGEAVGQSDVTISLNALSGNSSFQTLKIRGIVGTHQLTMLIDSGSTHNFLRLS